MKASSLSNEEHPSVVMQHLNAVSKPPAINSVVHLHNLGRTSLVFGHKPLLHVRIPDIYSKITLQQNDTLSHRRFTDLFYGE